MPVPTTIADLNQTAAVNSPLGTDTVGPNLDDYLRALSAFIRQLFDGTPFLLGSVAGTNTITGTSSVPFTAYVAGQTFRFVAAGTNTGATTLNVNALGAKAITKIGTNALEAGDIKAGAVYQVVYDGTQFQISAVPAPLAHGQCQLSFTSATQVKLSPYGGQNLTINGASQQIPAAGITLANSGLAASTLYYIYAYMNSGVMTLEASTTGHSAGTNGVEIKTGDPTRTLVGMVRTNASSQFVNSSNARLVSSYFNRRNVSGTVSVAGVSTFSNTTPAEISTTYRIEHLNWGDESLCLAYSGRFANSTSVNAISIQAYVDGTPAAQPSTMVGAVNGSSIPFFTGAASSPSEGYHVLQLFGNVDGSTGAINSIQGSVMTRG